MLEVRDLHVALAENTAIEAVSGVSFDVSPGECLALVGESGCGKSMTALATMRLLPETMRIVAGHVHLDGVDIFELSERQMCTVRGSRISMIFQEPATSLNPVMTVGDQIVEAVRLHENITRKEAKKRALLWLERVGVDDAPKRFHAFAHELSGGQKQRVMIAMALACRPSVVVADEPTTALDVTLQAQILDLLKRLQKEENIALLLITHDLAVVRRYADRVGLMYAGQIVEERTTEAFFDSPAHPYARQLLNAVPSRDKSNKELKGIAGTVPELGRMPPGCRYAPRCPLACKACEHTAPKSVCLPTGGFVRCTRNVGVWPKEVSHEHVRPRPGEVVFAVKNLSVAYEKPRGIFRSPELFEAVKDVTLELRCGSTLALVGESGSGKTTLAKAALGLLENARVAGDVVIDGQSAYRKGKFDARVRGKVQIVFQDPFASLDPRMTVGECIAEGMRALGSAVGKDECDKRTAELLRRVGLPESAAMRLPHEFSGGQRQRIAIARALAVNPKIIICDEPTSALDVSVQAQILNLLREIQAQTGVAILLITHNFAVVEYAADTVAVMKKGRLVESGPTEEVLVNPKHDYSRSLLSAVLRI